MLLKNNVIANYLGQGWTALIGLAFIPVYISYLGMEAWGLVGFMSMMQAWLTLLDLGLTPTLSREMTRYQAGAHSAQSIRDLLRSLELIYGGVAVVIMVIVWCIAPWVARYWLNATQLSEKTIANAINMIGLVLAARMAEQVYRGAIQGLQHQVWLNGAQSILATFRWAGVLGVFAWMGASIETFFVWQGLISSLTVVIFARQTYKWLAPGKRPARFNWKTIAQIQQFAGGMAATTCLALMLTQMDKLLLSKLVPLKEFGHYTLAASVAGALGFLMTPIATAVLPHMTALVANSDEPEIIAIYHRASQWLAAILIPAALVMATFAEPLLQVWTDDRVLAQEASPLLALLALGTLCNGLMHVPYMTQLAYGWTGLAVRVNIVAVCFMVPCIFWAVPRFGAIGAAWAWLALNSGYVLIGMHFMHRRLLPNEKVRWYSDAVLKPLIIGSLIVLASRWWICLPQGRLFLGATIAGVELVVLGALLLTIPASRAVLQHQFRVFLGQK